EGFTFKYEEQELGVLRLLYKLHDVVHEAAERFAPNIIANYLYDLTSKFNLYYQKFPIINADDLKTSAMRLNVTRAYGNAIKELLELLGIETVNKM
ncbi:MAG: DALR anticodon-binding domain-containing protein, partial [Actinobacteria bacterium]|nr:DALR anticodon-binding domain-containing protein [Actinomycetota bacterium]